MIRLGSFNVDAFFSLKEHTTFCIARPWLRLLPNNSCWSLPMWSSLRNSTLSVSPIKVDECKVTNSNQHTTTVRQFCSFKNGEVTANCIFLKFLWYFRGVGAFLGYITRYVRDNLVRENVVTPPNKLESLSLAILVLHSTNLFGQFVS
jgi:hypothetical protein